MPCSKQSRLATSINPGFSSITVALTIISSPIFIIPGVVVGVGVTSISSTVTTGGLLSIMMSISRFVPVVTLFPSISFELRSIFNFPVLKLMPVQTHSNWSSTVSDSVQIGF